MSVPTHLGRYRLGERVGEGGLGEVFLAQAENDAGFRKTLAVKRVRPSFARDPEVARILTKEATLVQRLHHGGIVQIFDFGLDDGSPFLVMEFIDGVSLARLVDDLRQRGERLPVQDAILVVEHVAHALAYAHRCTDENGVPLGIVHRDVTPRNILLSRDGVVKLADFGIAKVGLGRVTTHTLPGVVKGSMGYMAPEQAMGKVVDARTDQYATGIVLKELLLGTHPSSSGATLSPSTGADDEIDEALVAIVERATAHEAKERFASMDELAAQLEAWRVGRGMRPAPDSLASKVRRARGEATPLARPLGADVLAMLGSPAKEQHTAHAGTAVSPRRVRRVALVILGIALVGIAVVAISKTDSVPYRGPRSLAASVPDAAKLDLALVPKATESPKDSVIATAGLRASKLELPTVPAPRLAVNQPKTAMRREGTEHPGKLMVNVIPWAEVVLDGGIIGTTPISVNVPRGLHELVLRNPDTGRTQTRKITITSGAELKITSW